MRIIPVDNYLIALYDYYNDLVQKLINDEKYDTIVKRMKKGLQECKKYMDLNNLYSAQKSMRYVTYLYDELLKLG
jgi:hypothetical protein